VYRLIDSTALFALAVFILIMRQRGIRTGKLPERGAILSRDKNPQIFQYAQLAYLGLAILAFVAALAMAALGP